MKRVNKYNLAWQLARVKNKKEKFLFDKIENIKSFLKKYHSLENKERVLNYLKGLSLGYKDFLSKSIINSEINNINEFFNSQPILEDFDISINKVDTQDLLFLYQDLYLRNEKWLNGNYYHKEQNIFLKSLYNALKSRGIEVDKNFDRKVKGKVTHKFIY